MKSCSDLNLRSQQQASHRQPWRLGTSRPPNAKSGHWDSMLCSGLYLGTHYAWYKSEPHDAKPLLKSLFVVDSRSKIVGSGALIPLMLLTRSKNVQVQCNAIGALLNVSLSGVPWYPSRFRDKLIGSESRTGQAGTCGCRNHPCSSRTSWLFGY